MTSSSWRRSIIQRTQKRCWQLLASTNDLEIPPERGGRVLCFIRQLEDVTYIFSNKKPHDLRVVFYFFEPTSPRKTIYCATDIVTKKNPLHAYDFSLSRN